MTLLRRWSPNVGVTATLLSLVLVPAGTTAAEPHGGDRLELTNVTPADPRPVSAAEYATRRAALAEEMGDGVLVVFGASAPELDYLPYAQNSSFRYLTGLLEPDAGLLIVKEGDRVEESLFVLRRNPDRELWEGARLGTEGATALTGIPSHPNDRFIATLEEEVARLGRLYVLTPLMGDALREGTLTREQQILRGVIDRVPDVEVVPIGQAIQRLRSLKSPVELDLIRRAVEVTVIGHREAIRSIEPGMNEFEIQALFEYYFRRNGAERPAYSSIVGSGPNSTTLHYRTNDRTMQAGEVVLMDVGASYRGYAADVTRTVPVSGTFSPEQREIYEIVLAAQKAAEEQIRIGGGWSAVNRAADQVIAEGLARLGLIDAPDATYYCAAPSAGNACPQFRLYYMHALGHGVGLDVHDPEISYFETFQPGSAFTLEPGIYIRSDVLDHLRDSPENRAMTERLRPAVSRYAGIGIRTEDVYLITEAGVERVSAGVPREIDDIEALMAETGTGQHDRRPEMIRWYERTTPGR